MKATAYNALPHLGFTREVESGSVLWICPHRMTPIALEQAGDQESHARKYVAIGTTMVNGYATLLASRVDLTPFTPLRSDDAGHELPGMEVPGMSIGVPEPVDRKEHEVRLGLGKWTLDSLRGAIYTWASDRATIDTVLAEAFRVEPATV